MTAAETRVAPVPTDDGAAYDPIAELYARAFVDIRVRRDEWCWLRRHVLAATPRGSARVLDIGCGNGALLCALHADIAQGVGVDVSTRAIAIAQQRSAELRRLRFATITSAELPFPDDSFDVVISFLSFRYLDRDASIREAKRVLRPGGRMLIVDMVAAQPKLRDAWTLLRSALTHATRPLLQPRFHRSVRELTRHPDWQRMLQRHPIAQHWQYATCFARHFDAPVVETLNATLRQAVIALDSGPLDKP